MIKLQKVTGTSWDKLKHLIVKAWNGKSDTRTAREASSFGVDSNPIEDMVALYVKSEVDGAESIIGYFNKNRLAERGEMRIFSTDSTGDFKFNIWLRAEGEALIGDSNIPAEYTNFLTKYNEYKAENDKLKATVDSLVTKWNAFCAQYVPGSPSVAGLPATLSTSTVTPNTSNFELAKASKIKTNS